MGEEKNLRRSIYNELWFASAHVGDLKFVQIFDEDFIALKKFKNKLNVISLYMIYGRSCRECKIMLR